MPFTRPSDFAVTVIQSRRDWPLWSQIQLDLEVLTGDHKGLCYARALGIVF
jgi:hypothetical protein